MLAVVSLQVGCSKFRQSTLSQSGLTNSPLNPTESEARWETDDPERRFVADQGSSPRAIQQTDGAQIVSFGDNAISSDLETVKLTTTPPVSSLNSIRQAEHDPNYDHSAERDRYKKKLKPKLPFAEPIEPPEPVTPSVATSKPVTSTVATLIPPSGLISKPLAPILLDAQARKIQIESEPTNHSLRRRELGSIEKPVTLASKPEPAGSAKPDVLITNTDEVAPGRYNLSTARTDIADLRTTSPTQCQSCDSLECNGSCETNSSRTVPVELKPVVEEDLDFAELPPGTEALISPPVPTLVAAPVTPAVEHSMNTDSLDAVPPFADYPLEDELAVENEFLVENEFVVENEPTSTTEFVPELNIFVPPAVAPTHSPTDSPADEVAKYEAILREFEQYNDNQWDESPQTEATDTQFQPQNEVQFQAAAIESSFTPEPNGNFSPVGHSEDVESEVEPEKIETSDQDFAFQVPPSIAPELVAEPIPVAELPAAVETNASALQVKSLEQLKTHLELSNGAFCTEISGFGQFKTFPSNEFRSNQRMLVYVEIENYVSAPTEIEFEMQYTTRLRGRYAIFDEQGREVQQSEYPVVEDIARRKRRDFYMYFPIKLNELQPGNYQLKLQVEDLNGDMTTTIEPAMQFQVR